MNTAKKVAINTAVQYVRLALNLFIGLYSVRIILKTLGPNDYGLYDVIAGVIAIIGFINTSLSQTSIRFISVSIGKKDQRDLAETFRNCFVLHLLIALGLTVLIEIAGIFLFDGFLNIERSRVETAKFIYHCMAAILFLQIMITPFSALIISHEKFVYTAVISILDSLLKLGVAFLLLTVEVDRLKLYGLSMLAITVVNTFFFLIYNLVNYKEEIKMLPITFKGLSKFSHFAGWTVLDVLGSVATRQGYSVLLNKFFGTSINAAFAISRQVEGQMYSISAAVIDTLKPQIMKSYGANDKDRMFRLSMTAGKFGFTLMSLVAIPLLVNMQLLMEIWLVSVPSGAVLFTRLMVLACMSEQLTRGLVYACQATGRIKWFSIIVSSIRFSALPLSILFFSFGFSPYVAILIFLLCETFGSLSRIIIVSRLEKLNVLYFFKEIFLRSLPPFMVSAMVCYVLSLLRTDLMYVILTSTITCVIYLIMVYQISLSSVEKETLIAILKSKIRR